jgi:hypothetical protein
MVDSNHLEQAFDNVRHTLVRFHDAFEERIMERRQQGKEDPSILELTKGMMAMKDSAGIYLAWANHYMKQLDKTNVLDMDEMAEE